MKKDKALDIQSSPTATDTPENRSTDHFDFEASITRIEEIVSSLEEGKTGLDQSIELYEEGIRLIRRCASALDVAERKIQVLQRGKDGSLDCKDFHPEQEQEQEKEDGNERTES